MIELDNRFVAGQFFDLLLSFFASEGHGVVAHELMKLFGKFRIGESFAHGVANDLDALLGRVRYRLANGDIPLNVSFCMPLPVAAT